ncbi:MAG: Asp-tRNA(Asn)/Glu-tRNA(Gln) amidotransferase subunit GatC [Candidatus Nanopelagicales bacterium]
MTESTSSPAHSVPAHLTREDVDHLAHLARLAIPADQLDHYAEQLDAILVSVSRVAEVAAADVPPMSHPQDLSNVARADEPRSGLTRTEALSGAPAEEDDRFRVPRILEDSE